MEGKKKCTCKHKPTTAAEITGANVADNAPETVIEITKVCIHCFP